VWIKPLHQPPNSTLGGFHMTQTTHDFVDKANPTRNSPKSHAMGSNGGLGIFYLKCFQAWLKFFHSIFQTTWVVFPNGDSKHCAQGSPPYKVGR
jgi:hypothetical protein